MSTKKADSDNEKDISTYQVPDKRMMRPLLVKDKVRNVTFLLANHEECKVGDKMLQFNKPNNISLFVSIAHREETEAIKLYDDFIKKRLKGNSKITLADSDLKPLYDYFERVQTAIITIYTAIEALSNAAIPDDYTIEKVNSKKVKEIWTKESIERWYSTSEKIGNVVPKILNMDSPKKYKVWTYFKKLEEIRNDIIHQKTTKNETDLNTKFLKKLLDREIFKTIDSGFVMIQFFCEKAGNGDHSYLPMGFGELKLEPVEVDFDEEFTLIEE